MLNYAESFQRSARNESLAELQSGARLMSDGERDLHTALISCILINSRYGCGASSGSLCVSLARRASVPARGAVRCRSAAPFRTQVSFQDSDINEHTESETRSHRESSQRSGQNQGWKFIKHEANSDLIGSVELSSWKQIRAGLIQFRC